ncbi:2-amino-4-hydroxy-6-hydroxymethyldihydropteridine diphosphokinase [Ramlibacter tataouinensis]|uniref:2-amino-4-hydroxy-6- hydroxymethyldihydropteridine diphosphokinase n=1 Tax=Ramlibacter tataouinensis TaxID=94132 RepID=UPI0022F39198|nr:2-amino-4-hydroxy-6-hydroxymethyldihydropteridine diphosphokinase [Ramlibacter tataouinensis]WBY00958.1 2-amino-4-hydroxy-6-hydroxymethyldihydropteridine diphosphokinase [Ramlibacter tataouinensis]
MAAPAPASPAAATRGPVTAYVALGANLGDAVAAVSAALQRLAALPQSSLAAHSSLYRTAPVQATGPDFVNAVAALRTSLTAPALLAELQRLEDEAGRDRPYRNAPRTLDLDLLLYGDARIASPRLVVPHPRMHERAFVLVPLAEIAPQLVAPAALAAMTSQVIARIP